MSHILSGFQYICFVVFATFVLSTIWANFWIKHLLWLHLDLANFFTSSGVFLIYFLRLCQTLLAFGRVWQWACFGKWGHFDCFSIFILQQKYIPHMWSRWSKYLLYKRIQIQIFREDTPDTQRHNHTNWKLQSDTQNFLFPPMFHSKDSLHLIMWAGLVCGL